MIWQVVIFAAITGDALGQRRIAPPAPEPQGAMSKSLDLSGAYSNIRSARQEVVRDAKRLAAFWREHAGDSTGMPIPVVDFAKSDVVAVFAGAKPTGGYRVSIDRVKRVGKAAVIEATIHKPGPGAITTQAFTFAFAMKSVPKLPAQVRFKVTEVIDSPR